MIFVLVFICMLGGTVLLSCLAYVIYYLIKRHKSKTSVIPLPISESDNLETKNQQSDISTNIKSHSSISDSESFAKSFNDYKQQIDEIIESQRLTRETFDKIAKSLQELVRIQGLQASYQQQEIPPAPKPTPKPNVATFSEYGNIGHAPNLVYQTNYLPNPEHVLEIRYTEADRNNGELFVRSDLSNERIAMIQQNTSSFLPVEVGECVGTAPLNPTRIVTVRCGKVKREDYFNWRIIDPLQYSFE